MSDDKKELEQLKNEAMPTPAMSHATAADDESAAVATEDVVVAEQRELVADNKEAKNASKEVKTTSKETKTASKNAKDTIKEAKAAKENAEADDETDDDKAAKADNRHKKEEDFGSALKEAIHEQAREDEQTLTPSVTLRKILGGDFLTASMIRRQIGMILIIVAFTIVYISNRYSCQRNLLEIDRLNTELQDAKYKALSSSSMLTEKCRESHVLDMLKANNDSLLHIADQPPYIIYVPQK